MADGSHTIEIDDALAEGLRAEAKAAGVSFEDYVRKILATGLSWGPHEDVDPDPAIDARIAREAKESGEYFELAEVSAWLQSWGTDNPLPDPVLRRR